MSKPNFSDFKKVWNNTKQFPDRTSISKHFQVSYHTVSGWLAMWRSEGKNLDDRRRLAAEKTAEQEQDVLESMKLRKQIQSLKKDLSLARKEAVSSMGLKKMIHEISSANFDKTPRWLEKKNSPKDLHGIPLLFISDVHFDEVVDPGQINGVNEFNREIAERRLENTAERAKRILFDYISKPRYDGLVLAFGGDNVSGDIHEELAETNEKPILVTVVDLTSIYIRKIEYFLDYFDQIFVPCVVGNHGRKQKGYRFKHSVFNNYEWLIYQYLAKHFKDEPRVQFQIPDGPDAIFQIYDMTFCLTHGNQFRGGSGIAGIMTPLHLGLHKKQKKQAALHRPFDVLMFGHFHQYFHTNSLVGNGSVKGYDEYANENNFPYEPPQQAMFINNPRHGMVMRTPIFCDDTQLPQEPSMTFKFFGDV